MREVIAALDELPEETQAVVVGGEGPENPPEGPEGPAGAGARLPKSPVSFWLSFLRISSRSDTPRPR